MYLNRITLIGFTGQEPKTFATQAGKEITRLSIATTRRYQQNSEWKEKTQWHDCVAYGRPCPVRSQCSERDTSLSRRGTDLPRVRPHHRG